MTDFQKESVVAGEDPWKGMFNKLIKESLQDFLQELLEEMRGVSLEGIKGR